MRSGGCLFGRREWKTGCGQGVVVIIKTSEERRMPLLCTIAKIIVVVKGEVVFDSKLTDKRIDYAFSIL